MESRHNNCQQMDRHLQCNANTTDMPLCVVLRAAGWEPAVFALAGWRVVLSAALAGGED